MTSTTTKAAERSQKLRSLTAPTRLQIWRARGLDLVQRRLLMCSIVAFLVFRVFSAIVMQLVAGQQDPSFIFFSNGHQDYWQMTHVWDGRWYQTIVEQGYPAQLPEDGGVVQQNPWAFYPMYPAMVWVLMHLTGGSFAVVGSLLSVVLGAVAVGLMAVLVRDKVGPVVAFCVVCVFAASPPSPVLQMTYTESLALVLLIGALLALQRQQWWLASAAALATGLARPVAVPLGVVALVAVWMRWREREERPVTRPEWLAMGSTLVACGVAGGLWPAIAALRTGVPSAYTDTMASWRTGNTIVYFQPWAANFDELMGNGVLAALVLTVLIVGFVVITVGPWADAMGAVMRTWLLAYGFYLLAVLDAWTSTYRYLLFMFPILIVFVGAGWKDHAKRLLVGWRTVIWVGLGLGWQVWWCWTLLVLRHVSGDPI
ncbi:hypothetical protein GCM10011492_40510 [Flexivirga endophytica]|uniref:Glycosyltransferase RgtA/B/C/D-like domain-containing protein n=1 Tax=Flexivirga endophytica TaxID=1849103 RepID=A0A916THD8_9MICO|nr:hypothetical protein [Flexivirga endophytica]GGB45305.1 hypothetical protein GCM10011492_40510 [Flexivirga endophytica]GHB66688.1 hypothetical protein GCM10008112_39480 [Flexivirga endophytica]